MIYFTSDLHLCHNRDFLYEPRGFNNVWDMNEAIIENWNNVVGYNDDVYILGDLMLNDNATGLSFLKKLNGKLHIILGNHDTDTRIELYRSLYNVVSVEYATTLKYNGYHFYLSHYPTLCGNYDDDKPLNKKVISLCGHTHTKDKFADMNKGLIYHVELDAHNNTPVSLDQIIEDINNYVKENK